MTSLPTASPGSEAASPDAPVNDPSLASSAEPRGQRLVRHARRARMYTSAGLFVALLVVLAVLAAANTRSAKLDWVVGSTHASLVWIILVAAVVGWLLGIVTGTVVRRRTRRSG